MLCVSLLLALPLLCWLPPFLVALLLLLPRLLFRFACSHLKVEYALEAVKQGACAVGLVSKDWALVGSLKRASSELASYQQKVFQVDAHMGIAASGLISDARVQAQYMRNECLNHRYVYNAPMPTERLVSKLSDKAQHFTQKADKRPYGVGLLVAGYDPQTGPHLFQTEPSGIYFEYKAQAIGARAQSAKTYLEKNYDSFAGQAHRQTGNTSNNKQQQGIGAIHNRGLCCLTRPSSDCLSSLFLFAFRCVSGRSRSSRAARAEGRLSKEAYFAQRVRCLRGQGCRVQDPGG